MVFPSGTNNTTRNSQEIASVLMSVWYSRHQNWEWYVSS